MKTRHFAFILVFVLIHFISLAAYAGLNFCGGQNALNVNVFFSQDTLGNTLYPYNGTTPIRFSHTKGFGYPHPVFGSIYSCNTPPITTQADCGDPLATRWVNLGPVVGGYRCGCKSYMKAILDFTGVSPTPSQPLDFIVAAFFNPADTSVIPNIPAFNRTTADVLELQNFPTGVNNNRFVDFQNPGQYAQGFLGLVEGRSQTSSPSALLFEIITPYHPGAATPLQPADFIFYAYKNTQFNNETYNCDMWASRIFSSYWQP